MRTLEIDSKSPDSSFSVFLLIPNIKAPPASFIKHIRRGDIFMRLFYLYASTSAKVSLEEFFAAIGRNFI